MAQKIPRILYSLTLIVSSKREIAQHFEKRMMTTGIAHVIKIIVLATGPYNLLQRSSRLERGALGFQEMLLERYHP